MSELSRRLRRVTLRKRRRDEFDRYTKKPSGCEVVEAFLSGEATLYDLRVAWANDDLHITDYARVFPQLIDRMVSSRAEGLEFLAASKPKNAAAVTLAYERTTNGAIISDGDVYVFVPRARMRTLAMLLLGADHE